MFFWFFYLIDLFESVSDELIYRFNGNGFNGNGFNGNGFNGC